MKRLSLTLMATMVLVATALPVSPQGAFAQDQGEALPPLAMTTHAYAISATEAVLLGRFDPRGHRTVVRFEYGRTKAYGHVVPRYAEEEWFGEETEGEEEAVDCLRPGTVYHYRIIARNKFGTAHGRDQTFRTRAYHGKLPDEECNGRI